MCVRSTGSDGVPDATDETSCVDRKLGKQSPGLALGVPLFALPLLGLAVLISSLSPQPKADLPFSGKKHAKLDPAAPEYY